MGRGIAQVAAAAGHEVVVFDALPGAAERGVAAVAADLRKLAAKGRLGHAEAEDTVARLRAVDAMDGLAGAGVLIEAIHEDLGLKQALFREAGAILAHGALLASNTSALPVTALAAVAPDPGRVVGMHFFNPVPRMALCEIVRARQSSPESLAEAESLAAAFGKQTVTVADTPGFLVNRVARPYYLEAVRMLGAGEGDVAGIDAAARAAGFPMGPFTLMDFIGIDVNLAVSRAVFDGMSGEPRFRPHVLQQQQVHANQLGRKNGQGWYAMDAAGQPQTPDGAGWTRPYVDAALPGLDAVASRLVAAIINEAHHVWAEGWAGADEGSPLIDRSIRQGLNYPHGPIAWGDALGLDHVAAVLEANAQIFGGERFRLAPLLRRRLSR
jgi:3-hydroxybutyryl-CoA dehydrogenase